ncbi:MAG: glycosyltransferase family 4 protein, partial [Chloroflexota bacterium]|nr:glycosyltransferase family 4 protein [Chloroflexota bacterium]
MKICLLCYRGNPRCGGQGIYIYYISRELYNLGHEVHVISGPPYPEVVDGVRLHKLNSLNLYESNDSFLANLSRVRNPVDFHEFMAACMGMFPEPLTFSTRAYHKIKQLLPYHKFDIIHDNQGLGYGLLSMKRLNVPVIATIHHPIPIDRELNLAQAKNFKERFKLRRWYSFCTMQRLVSKRIERIITVSQSSAEEIERSFKVPQDRLRVVYNGLDTDIFKSDENTLKEPSSLILVNSGEQPIKGVPYLLRALQLLQD